MKKFSVISGSASEELAKKIAKKLKAEFISTSLKVFPDGENKITFNKIPKKGSIIVVQSTYPPVDSNLLQLLSIVSNARKFSSDIIVVVPYLGYARQDREFLPGEVVTMQTIAEILESVGAKKIIVVDIHSLIGLKLFKINSLNVTAVPKIAEYLSGIKLNHPLVVSPDHGGSSRAKDLAELLGIDFVVLEKQRDRKTGKVKIKSTDMKHLANRDLIIIDDMISTGGSIIKATEFLKKQKCGRIFVACTHALMLDNAEKRIKHAGISKIISTNTIPGKNSFVDVSDIIVKAII